jgi:hypothetical protein
MVGWMMPGGWGHSSWLVTVITLLAILELHDMVGVVGTRVPRELLLQNCFKVWIVGIVLCWHHLFGDDKLACVLFIMSSFPIFLNLSHIQRGKKWLIAKSYNSIALSLWQDQNEISKCIQEAQLHGRQLLHNTPPYAIESPPLSRPAFAGFQPGFGSGAAPGVGSARRAGPPTPAPQ